MAARFLFVSVILASGLLTAQGLLPTDLVERRVTAKVVMVVDGDTVDVVIGEGRRERVRLHGIDAPEKGEPFSAVARATMITLADRRMVALIGQDVDVFGRLVARILVDGVDVSESMLAAGYACTFRRYVVDHRLEAALKSAQSLQVGMWRAGAQHPACVGREFKAVGIAVPDPVGFSGNVRSRVYHASTCQNAKCRNCTRHFATQSDAERAGFRPAGDCLTQ